MRSFADRALPGGVPAIAALVAAVAVIRIVCRRPTLRRLSFALSLIALTGSVALFRALAPAEAPLLDPYLRFLALHARLRGVQGRGGPGPGPPAGPERTAAGPGHPPRRRRRRSSVASSWWCSSGRASAWMSRHPVATSAALSIVLGFALQETLANLFAGLALMLERPFEPGDWIQMGKLTGQVQEVSWRAVRLKLMRQEDYLVVPE